jgi:hypothetical protein
MNTLFNCVQIITVTSGSLSGLQVCIVPQPPLYPQTIETRPYNGPQTQTVEQFIRQIQNDRPQPSYPQIPPNTRPQQPFYFDDFGTRPTGLPGAGFNPR